MSGRDVSRPPVCVVDSGEPTVTLEEVDIRDELLSRPRRSPDAAGEDRALAMLAREMAENPRNMLQKLVEVAVELCSADTAGISLLEGDVFRWEAVAGVFADFRNGTMPRAASPCGICIDRDATQLMHLPDRCFPALRAEPRFVEALLIPFHDHSKPVGTVWVVTHNFDRRFDREDERIITLLAQFASAGWQLWRAGAAAEEANRRKDEFLAMLSHELRTPLTAVLGWVRMLRTGRVPPATTDRALEVIERNTRMQIKFIEDMLDVSRIVRGTLEFNLAPTNLPPVIEAAVEALRPAAETAKVRIDTVFDAARARVLADGERLQQIFWNLLSNAVKFSDAGGRVEVRLERIGDQAKITVSDKGKGISPEFLPHVFEPFRQAERRASYHQRGLGLGLGIARHLVELHGGTITAASEGEGQGATFTVTLPLLQYDAKDE